MGFQLQLSVIVVVMAFNVASAYHHYHHFDDYFRHPHSEESDEYDSWEDSDEHYHHHKPSPEPYPRQKVTQTLKTTSELLHKSSQTTKSITRSTLPQSTKPVITDLPTRSFSALKPLPRYEVHEAVDDIPNNEIFKPVVTNFNIKKPLNIAGGNQALNTGQNNPDDGPKRTYVSISANGDYVDDDKNINEHTNFAGLTEFWHRVKKTVGNAVNKAVYSWNKES